ncbi:MAG: hypothetical protein ACQER7_05110 [Bacteroidota bacterium]
MKKFNLKSLAVLVGVITLTSACEKSDDLVPQNEPDSAIENAELKSANTTKGDVELKSAHKTKGFEQGIVAEIDGEDYYFAGPPVKQDDRQGTRDVPGHYWVQTGPDKFVGKHYNTGPFGASKWWSSDADDGELLFIVHAVTDEWTEEKAEQYASEGFVHYHEWVSVDDGSLHPTKVVWLKHTAKTFFTFDGGPGAPNPPYEHKVTPGVDYKFMPNYMTPYNPDEDHH